MKKLIVPILALIFMSCEEELAKVADSAAAVETLNEFVIVNKVFQDAGNNSGDAVFSAQVKATPTKINESKTNGPDITVTPFDLTTFPKTIVIDYGDGILCEDGITRKGIATILSVNNWYGVPGSEHTTTFTNYYHNDYKVEGTHKVVNLGENNDGDLQYSVSIENGKITTSTGKTISYTENSTRTWVAGSSTPLNIWDDEYTLNGTQTGVSSKGVSYSITTEESLHFVLKPRNIKSGILDITVGSIDDIKMNFTTSTITILGKEFPILN
ncbi:hypothetical protein [Mariniflexile sp.]|uniref:hypothetical protein n=1 Tax=Mariniflexile sp. TaxID=1979402 RepID=UPI00356635BE